MQYPAPPQLGQARDVRQFVGEARRGNNSPRSNLFASAQNNRYFRIIVDDGVHLRRHKLAPVLRYFLPYLCQKLAGWRSFMAGHSMHMGSKTIARAPRVHDKYAAPGASQHERRRQSRNSAADNNGVIYGFH